MNKERLLIVTGGNRRIVKQIALSALDKSWQVVLCLIWVGEGLEYR